MTNKQNAALNGLMTLTENEAKEVITEFEKYLRESDDKKRQFQEQIQRNVKVYVGPTNVTGSCPCCNR